MLALFLCTAAFLSGCATGPGAADSATGNDPPDPAGEVREGFQVREFHLSPGDRIQVSVYGHPELDMAVQIPPSGRFFYPIAGEVAASGQSLEALRKMITRRLAEPKPPRIGVGDRIAVRVFRNPDLDAEMLMPSDGVISLPLAGEVDLVGKSPHQASRIIEQKLARHLVEPQVIVNVVESRQPTVIEDPQVTVSVLEFGGQKAFVFGEVYRPGVFYLEGATTLVELLAMAGGPTLDAQPRSVLLIRKQPDTGKAGPRRIDVDAFVEQGDVAGNPLVTPGDIVYVPRSFIADVDRFFEHLGTIVRPIVDIERGYWLGQNIEAGPSGGGIAVSSD
jgi:polysaccharide export outer membrane protein